MPRDNDPGAVDSAVAIALLTRFIDTITASVSREFEAKGIDSILLKGPAFARLLYDHEGERVYSDTDLLVRERDRERAEQLLRDSGFERIDRDVDWVGPAPKYAHSYQRVDGAVVDLHWRLSGATVSSEHIWETVSGHTVPLEVGGRTAAVLDAPATAVLVALHHAHHGTGRDTTSSDLERAVERLALETWRVAADIADELGASEPFAAGLRLAQYGNALADDLALDRPLSVEIWLKTHPSSYGAWVLDRFHQTPSLRGKFMIFLQVAAPPPSVMTMFFPLARRGRCGLVAAYMLRPLRLIAHAGPAARDWIRARRALRAQRDLRAGG